MTGIEHKGNKAPVEAGVPISWFPLPDKSEKSIRGLRYDPSTGRAWIRERP